MHKSAFAFFLLLGSSISAAQEVGGDVSQDNNTFILPSVPPPGIFLDEPESDFFQVLRARHIQEVPYTFEETVDMATVIGRGFFVDVLPGRTIQNTRRPGIPPISTVIFKLQTTHVVKGNHQANFYIEYPMHWSNLSRLKETLYRGEVLFVLGPPPEFYAAFSVDVRTSAEAAAELGDHELYGFVLQSSLFTMSRSGDLTSAIDFSQDYGDLYSRIRSLENLATHVRDLLRSDQETVE